MFRFSIKVKYRSFDNTYDNYEYIGSSEFEDLLAFVPVGMEKWVGKAIVKTKYPLANFLKKQTITKNEAIEAGLGYVNSKAGIRIAFVNMENTEAKIAKNNLLNMVIYPVDGYTEQELKDKLTKENRDKEEKEKKRKEEEERRKKELDDNLEKSRDLINIIENNRSSAHKEAIDYLHNEFLKKEAPIINDELYRLEKTVHYSGSAWSVFAADSTGFIQVACVDYHNYLFWKTNEGDIIKRNNKRDRFSSNRDLCNDSYDATEFCSTNKHSYLKKGDNLFFFYGLGNVPMEIKRSIYGIEKKNKKTKCYGKISDNLKKWCDEHITENGFYAIAHFVCNDTYETFLLLDSNSSLENTLKRTYRKSSY